MIMELSTRVAKAIDEALSAVAADAPPSVVVRSALRVATLRQDATAEAWLHMELHGMRIEEGTHVRNRELLSRLSALLGPDEAQRRWETMASSLMARRTIKQAGDDGILAHGVAELELITKSIRALANAPITPGMTPIDTGLASMDRDKARVQSAPILLERDSILERIKDAAYTYVLEAEAQLLAGEAIPDVIAQGRAFVEKQLAARAPAALEALRAAEKSSVSGEREAASHTATSCRRAIKSLADSLYPPGPPVKGSDGVERKMDDEHYRNRLTEYVVSHRGRSTHADLLGSNIVALGTRLKSLDDLASKGVHADLSRAEVESCVSWVYMLAADLLRVEEPADSAP